MSQSPELPTNVEVQAYQSDVLAQHLVQADTASWLTSESPIARALSAGMPLQHRTSIGHQTVPVPLQIESRRFPEDEIADLVEPASHPFQFNHTQSHLHLSELETSYAEISSGLPWHTTSSGQMPYGRPHSTSTFQPVSTYMTREYPSPVHLHDPSSPYSTPSLFDDSSTHSPYLSSPDLHSARYTALAPRSSPQDDYEVEEDEEDVTDGKPYARLIYEALLQAPGHRMMLRDIYEWFERNTNKPRESGSNGWQNSIRHNLSMNKAFENDKTHSTNARGEPKKSTSVWFLTQDALMHGVQSTTRYRKTGGVRKTGLSSSPDQRRQKSGAKGGRAARRAARLRRLEQSQQSWTPVIALDDVGPFDSLVHAATYLNDYCTHYDSNPPTPSEGFPYTPRSPVSRPEYTIVDPDGLKIGMEDTPANEARGLEFLFQHPLDAGLDDPW